MENKTKVELAISGAEVLTAIGVSTLVGGAIALVKPAKLGVIRKIAVSVGGMAIASMATDGVVAYVDKTVHAMIDSVKGVFVKKDKPEETDDPDEVTEE